MPQQNTGICTRLAAFDKKDKQRNAPATLNEKDRTVGVILATETPVKVWTEYGRADEVLLMSGATWPSTGQVPMLDTHWRYSVTGQLGSLRDFSVNGDALYAEAHFSETAEQAFTLIREGHLTDVSVGCRILEHLFVPENTTQTIDGRTFTGPVKVITHWEVIEGSFTPVGADKNAKTRAASDGQNREEPMPNKTVDPKGQGRAADNGNAPKEQTQRSAAQPVADKPVTGPENSPASNPAPAAEPSRAVAAAPSAESIRAEIADIMAIGITHNCVELAEHAVRSGTSLDAFRAQTLDHVAKRSAAHAPSHMPAFEVGQSDVEKFRAAASEALILRWMPAYAPKEVNASGVLAARAIAAGAHELRGYTMREMARESLRRAGLPIPADPMEMVGRAFTATTSDFPNILADAAHKAVHEGFEEAPETYEAWTGEATANDFRQHTGVNLNSFSALDIVPEGGEYTTGDMSDRGIHWQVATYGKLFSITRQAIINDDVNAFTKIPNKMGVAAKRTRGNAVYALLIGNPQMADGFALFSSHHGNLAATGGPINKDSYKAGAVAIGTRKGAQGEALHIPVRYLLVPVVRQDEAKILMNSQMIGTQAAPNQVNPWSGDAEIITESRLDMEGNAPWFMTGPKGSTISVASLFGNKGARVEQRQGWTVDGTQFKVSSDFGAYIEGYEALYKNPGQ